MKKKGTNKITYNKNQITPEEMIEQHQKKKAGDEKKFKWTSENVQKKISESEYNLIMAFYDYWNEPGLIDEIKNKYNKDLQKKKEQYYQKEAKKLGRPLNRKEKVELITSKLNSFNKIITGSKAFAIETGKTGMQFIGNKIAGVLSGIPGADKMIEPLAEKIGIKIDKEDPTNNDPFLSSSNNEIRINPNFLKKIDAKDLMSESMKLGFIPIKLTSTMGGLTSSVALIGLLPVGGGIIAPILMVLTLKSLAENVSIQPVLSLTKITCGILGGLKRIISPKLNIEISPDSLDNIPETNNPGITAGIKNYMDEISASPVVNNSNISASIKESLTTNNKTNNEINPEKTSDDIGKEWNFNNFNNVLNISQKRQSQEEDIKKEETSFVKKIKTEKAIKSPESNISK